MELVYYTTLIHKLEHQKESTTMPSSSILDLFLSYEGVDSLKDLKWPLVDLTYPIQRVTSLHLLNYYIECKITDCKCLKTVLSRHTLSFSSTSTLLVKNFQHALVRSFTPYQIRLIEDPTKCYHLTWGEKLLIIWLTIWNPSYSFTSPELFAIIYHLSIENENGFPFRIKRYDRLIPFFHSLDDFFHPVVSILSATAENAYVDSPENNHFLSSIYRVALYFSLFQKYQIKQSTGLILLLCKIQPLFHSNLSEWAKQLESYTQLDPLKNHHFNQWINQIDIYMRITEQIESWEADDRLLHFDWLRSNFTALRASSSLDHHSGAWTFFDNISWLSKTQVVDLLIYHKHYVILKEVLEKSTPFSSYGLIKVSSTCYYKILFEEKQIYQGVYYLTEDHIFFFGNKERIYDFQRYYLIPQILHYPHFKVRFDNSHKWLDYNPYERTVEGRTIFLKKLSLFFLFQPRNEIVQYEEHAKICIEFEKMIPDWHWVLYLIPFVDYHISPQIIEFFENKQQLSLDQMIDYPKPEPSSKHQYKDSDRIELKRFSLVTENGHDLHIYGRKWIYNKILKVSKMSTNTHLKELLSVVFQHIVLDLPFDYETSVNLFPSLHNKSVPTGTDLFINNKSLKDIILTTVDLPNHPYTSIQTLLLSKTSLFEYKDDIILPQRGWKKRKTCYELNCETTDSNSEASATD